MQSQPPSGGCVLKHSDLHDVCSVGYQPPSGGCVLKHASASGYGVWLRQPPSGGCVLKQIPVFAVFVRADPAAFGRLCVETIIQPQTNKSTINQPPSGGCVLKRFEPCVGRSFCQPAAFGRLCVETRRKNNAAPPENTSRLRAAVC